MDRFVARDDLLAARTYREGFGNSDPELHQGTTALGISRAVLQDLRAGRATEFRVQSVVNPATYFLGWLRPVGTVPLRVVVNNREVDLPALCATGRFGGSEESEFCFLNDPENPLTLRFKIHLVDLATTNNLQVVRIVAPADAGREIERDLQTARRAEVQGIYFDFGQATIRPESELVLTRIAEIVRTNPDWHMVIEGHTDNVGTAAANLELSRRRADAVRQVLVGRYRIDSTRLSSAGYGALRPRATNGTLEGRATNRRVELVRD